MFLNRNFFLGFKVIGHVASSTREFFDIFYLLNSLPQTRVTVQAVGIMSDNEEIQTWGSEDGTKITFEVTYQSFSGDNVARSQHVSTGDTVCVICLQ